MSVSIGHSLTKHSLLTTYRVSLRMSNKNNGKLEEAQSVVQVLPPPPRHNQLPVPPLLQQAQLPKATNPSTSLKPPLKLIVAELAGRQVVPAAQLPPPPQGLRALVPALVLKEQEPQPAVSATLISSGTTPSSDNYARSCKPNRGC